MIPSRRYDIMDRQVRMASKHLFPDAHAVAWTLAKLHGYRMTIIDTTTRRAWIVEPDGTHTQTTIAEEQPAPRYRVSNEQVRRLKIEARHRTLTEAARTVGISLGYASRILSGEVRA